MDQTNRRSTAPKTPPVFQNLYVLSSYILLQDGTKESRLLAQHQASSCHFIVTLHHNLYSSSSEDLDK
jgi:hypothetical protein